MGLMIYDRRIKTEFSSRGDILGKLTLVYQIIFQ